jgi:hypothetical protein
MTQGQPDRYCLWERQSKETDEHTFWQKTELQIATTVLYNDASVWHIFISLFDTHVPFFLAQINLSCFGTYLPLMFWHILVRIGHVLAYIYFPCFGT